MLFFTPTAAFPTPRPKVRSMSLTLRSGNPTAAFTPSILRNAPRSGRLYYPLALSLRLCQSLIQPDAPLLHHVELAQSSLHSPDFPTLRIGSSYRTLPSAAYLSPPCTHAHGANTAHPFRGKPASAYSAPLGRLGGAPLIGSTRALPTERVEKIPLLTPFLY